MGAVSDKDALTQAFDRHAVTLLLANMLESWIEAQSRATLSEAAHA